MSRDRETYLKFKPMADDLRKAESWCESDGVLNRNKTMQNLYKMGYCKQSEDGLMLTFDGATGYFPKEFIIDAIKAYQKQSEGEWKKSDKNGISINGYMVCSVCNVMIPNCDDNRYCLGRLDYCPRCGAKMKGGAE